ncbi:MAG: Asp-tRNA(Asn)/Glu-tRNA(Gln) amidotransferase subunit GatB [Candidatus Aureabacteria bacterium]|nr:Asp-tRNA(Asn)/Glu-tRNA(Gln) amidotransferase subunit GatB [Candidatus Auribacterota bacterium]
MSKWETVIGLEVHVQLSTQSKLFCNCSTAFGLEANSSVCPVCLGMPGVLPVMNRKAVELALLTGLALNCEVQSFSKMDRKNYYYPDLPKNYQVSQFDRPFSAGGWLDIEVKGSLRRIGITRVHLEEDAGKNIHSEKRGCSLVDFNRTGVPLLEIVSEPDLRSPEEAFSYLKSLRQIVRYLEVSDGNMEEGSLRCDANISVRLAGEKNLGTKVELKNLNSFRFIQKALEYEAERQMRICEKGEKVIQETRLFDDSQSKTFSMRTKEEAHDYRYFPEPDLVPFTFSPSDVSRIRELLPELPLDKKKRFMSEFGLPEYDADVLTGEKDTADYYERLISFFSDRKMASNWMMGEWMREMKASNLSLKETSVTPEKFAELLTFIEKGTINTTTGKEVLSEMFKSGASAGRIIQSKGLEQIGDRGELENMVKDVILQNPQTVEDYKSGKKQAFGFFVGQVMKKTKGKANPRIVNEILRELLEGQ